MPVLLVVALLLIGIWLGLRIKPAAFPAYSSTKPVFKTVPLPPGLPAPVVRFLQTSIGAQIPLIESAVITGRGRLRFMGITFHSRWRFIHRAGYDYRHYIEATIFGQPLFKVNERYLDGKSRMELPFGIVAEGPRTDAAANLGLWSECVWLPAIFATDTRLRWEPVDDTTARLIVPFEGGEDGFTIHFDAATGLIRQLESMRWRDEKNPEKIRWVNQIIAWRDFHGMKLPAEAAVIWADQGVPWFLPLVEDAAYNVDVSAYIRGKGI